MKQFLSISCILWSICCVRCIDYDSSLSIQMEHTLGCTMEKYCPRGTISIKSIRAGTAIIDQPELSKQQIEDLKKLADIDGFYSIRTLVAYTDRQTTEFLSSVKAKSFLESRLSDVINAWVLPNGAVIAVSFQVSNSTQNLHEGNGDDYNVDYKINSNFYLRTIEQAPVPDTASYIQKLEREREAREKGDVKDNRSFLAKYWMYIVPVAIFVMISGATNPEAGGAPAAR